MNLLEFISYCKLKGYVTEHAELPTPVWDHDAEKYFGVALQGRGYNASITYATIGEGAAIVNSSLYDHSPGSKLPYGSGGLREITEAFIPGD